jgi:hypothetical protein
MTDISIDAYIARLAICEASALIAAPHCRMRPKIFPEGNLWCVLYGDDLQMGIAGFGRTVEEACQDFDTNWSGQRRQIMKAEGRT